MDCRPVSEPGLSSRTPRFLVERRRLAKRGLRTCGFGLRPLRQRGRLSGSRRQRERGRGHAGLREGLRVHFTAPGRGIRFLQPRGGRNAGERPFPGLATPDSRNDVDRFIRVPPFGLTSAGRHGPDAQLRISPLSHAAPHRLCAMKKNSAIEDLLKVMARLRSPAGCPWDREQDHKSLRFHTVEEVYELMDAIEAGYDHEMLEELGDLLLQIVFHCQLAKERDAFDFDQVARHITDKLVRRHPHVFGETKVKNVDEVWANWEKIKHAEKHGTQHARPSALDGIPNHLPALLRAEKLMKKARKAGLAVVKKQRAG